MAIVRQVSSTVEPRRPSAAPRSAARRARRASWSGPAAGSTRGSARWGSGGQAPGTSACRAAVPGRGTARTAAWCRVRRRSTPSRRVWLGRPPARYPCGGPFPTAPRRTGRAAFTAPGSPVSHSATRIRGSSVPRAGGPPATGVDGGVAVAADDQGLAMARGHLLDPGRRGRPSCALEVLQAPHVVDLDVRPASRTARRCRPGAVRAAPSGRSRRAAVGRRGRRPCRHGARSPPQCVPPAAASLRAPPRPGAPCAGPCRRLAASSRSGRRPGGR